MYSFDPWSYPHWVGANVVLPAIPAQSLIEWTSSDLVGPAAWVVTRPTVCTAGRGCWECGNVDTPS